MRLLRIFGICLAISMPATPVLADIDSFFDVFWVGVGGDVAQWNQIQIPLSGGSGYPDNGPRTNGIWYDYLGTGPQEDLWGNPNPMPSWANQWFYDGKFRPERYKVVDIAFDYSLWNPLQRGGTDIVINWSLPGWIDPDPLNPSPPMDNAFIGRATVGEVWMEPESPGGHFTGHYDLRDYGCPYNPEWVSIDIAGYNVVLSNPSNPGSFNHYCVPEPGTLVLLGVGVTSLLVFSWRRKQTRA